MLILDGCSILFKAGIYFLGKIKDQIKQVNEFRKSYSYFIYIFTLILGRIFFKSDKMIL